MFAVVLLLTGLLAHARITRLLVADRITQPLRTAVVRRFGAGGQVAYLAHCRWCAGLWLAFPVAAVVAYVLPALAGAERPLLTVLLALSYSQLTPLLATLEDED